MNIEALEATGLAPSIASAALRAELVALETDGTFMVRCDHGPVIRCDMLEGAFGSSGVPEPGDRLIVLAPTVSALGCVVGRIARYRTPRTEANITIKASESLRLQCGEASVDLRADGKVMVRGEDVLLRAKGTQRIRAGTVSIN